MKKRETSILTGSVSKNLLLFALPIALTGLLQLFYNMADTMIVGRFAGSNAMAAVGATGAISNLMISMFIGLSVGTNVCVAQSVGMGGNHAKDLVRRAVHTSIFLAMVSGVAIGVIGFFLAGPVLAWLNTPGDIIGQSTVYLRIIFLGMPAMLTYNFCAAILRAVGDSKTPLRFLSISGILNVLLNLLCVIVFRMGAAGVGIATVASQYLSVYLVLRFLIRQDTDYKLELSQLKIDKGMLQRIMRIGVPAGLQSAIFCLSNVQIQSSLNSFGADAVAGNAAAGNVEGMLGIMVEAIQQSSLTFVGQNYGAGNKKRVKRIIGISCLQIAVLTLLLVPLMLLYGRSLMSLFVRNEEAVIAVGIQRMRVILPSYVLAGIMTIFGNTTRALGSSVVPMLVSVTGICGVRMVWVAVVFPIFRTLETLYFSYSFSWAITLVAQMIFCLIVLKKKMTDKE